MNENENRLDNGAEEIEENKELNETEEQTETVQDIDYSALLQDIITNQESIIANQETIILQNVDILATTTHINNACNGIVNIVTLGAIICVAMFIVKNIFAKLF